MFVVQQPNPYSMLNQMIADEVKQVAENENKLKFIIDLIKHQKYNK
jgi:hypothetical protein